MRRLISALQLRFEFPAFFGGLLFAQRGYELNAKESLRTGSMVFRSDATIDDPFGGDTGYIGFALGNAYVVYDPPADLRIPAVGGGFESFARGFRPGLRLRQDAFAHWFDGYFDWQIPAHERTHAMQARRADVISYPIQNQFERRFPDWSWLYVADLPLELLIGATQQERPHDDRIQELGPVGVEAEVERRLRASIPTEKR